MTYENIDKSTLSENILRDRPRSRCMDNGAPMPFRYGGVYGEKIIIVGNDGDALLTFGDEFIESIDLIYIDAPYNLTRFIMEELYRDTPDPIFDKINGLIKKIRLSYPNTRDRETEQHKIDDPLGLRFKKYVKQLNDLPYDKIKSYTSTHHKILKADGVVILATTHLDYRALYTIMNEVFGFDNFIASIIPNENDITDVGFLCYAKNKEAIVSRETNYANPDNDINGDWISVDPTSKYGFKYDIINHNTGIACNLPSGMLWKLSKYDFENKIRKGMVVFNDTHSDGDVGFILKRYKKSLESINDMIESISVMNVEEIQDMFAENRFIDFLKARATR